MRYEVRIASAPGAPGVRWKVARWGSATRIDYGVFYNREIALMVAEFLTHADKLDSGTDEALAAREAEETNTPA